MDNHQGKILSVDCRPLRNMGNSVGNTFDLEALRALGVVDEDGNAVDGVETRQVIYDDGTIEITLETDTDQKRPADD